jgi:lysophospholipase L1-like esterase
MVTTAVPGVPTIAHMSTATTPATKAAPMPSAAATPAAAAVNDDNDEDSSPLRILCFGDSLTAGTWNMGCAQSPYSARLRERLCAAFPRREIRVTTDGENGCLVSVSSFTERLERQYRRVPEGFDWAIVLAGTK